MRVLHLTTEFPPIIWGGLGTAVGGIVRASARAGMDVGVLLVGGALSPSGRYFGWDAGHGGDELGGFGETMVQDGIRFFRVAPEQGIEAGLRFARSWQPDILHVHSAWLWDVASAIRGQCGPPIVFTVHSLDRAEYEIGGFITEWSLQDRAIHEADRVIAISQSERSLLLQFCPEVAPRLRVVGNGIDDESSARESTARRRNGPPVLMFSGRFVDRKGIRELLETIPTVLESVSDARFVLVGGYGRSSDVEREWLRGPLLPYRDRIRFTGWLPPQDVAEQYACADVLVVPSWYEPFGMVVLEGMLNGLALAASHIGGPAELLRHEVTALMFAPRDVGSLTSALLRLAGDRELRRRLGMAAAMEVRRRWLWSDISPLYGAIYAETV